MYRSQRSRPAAPHAAPRPRLHSRVAADPDGALRCLHGRRQPGRAGADQRPPPARLLRHRACRLHPARPRVLLLDATLQSRRPSSTTSSPTASPPSAPSAWSASSSAPPAATNSTPSSACTSAIRCSPRCCSCSSSRSPESRRWSASGPSSISSPRSSASLPARVPFALVALAIAFSAVSLYYYLQVLKRAYVMPAADESPIHAHPVTLAVLVAHRRRSRRPGLFPGAAAKLDCRASTLSDVSIAAGCWRAPGATRPVWRPVRYK